MQRPRLPRAPRSPTARPTSWVVAGAAASGVGAYLFQVLGARGLGDAAYAPIGVLWTVQYLAVSVPLLSVEAYLTRTITLHPGERAVLRRPLRVITGWLVTIAALLGLLTYRLRDALFDGLGELALTAVAIVLAYGGFAVVRGLLAGAGRFRSYGAATGLESVVRAVLAALVVVFAASTRNLAWTMPLGPLAVAVWWLTGGASRRQDEHGIATGPGQDARPPEGAVGPPAPATPAAGRFLASTTVANAAAQVLLAGGPLVLVPLGAGPSEVSVFFVTITAARAPLAFALGGLLSRLLPPFVRLARTGDERRLRRTTLALGALTLTVAVLAAAAAWLVGAPLVALLFGAGFRPDRTFVTLTAFGVLLATGSLVVNQVLIARGAHARLVPAWLSALALAAVVVASMTGTPTLRVATGFVAGELVALAGLLSAALIPGPPASREPVPAPTPAGVDIVASAGEV